MHMFENTRLAFQGILAHKMRSFLTMLGVIIGGFRDKNKDKEKSSK